MRIGVHCLTFLVLVLPVGPAAAEGVCELRLTSADRPAWTLTAGAGFIRGDKTRLKIEADTLYGFLFNEQTRLRLEPDRITGRLAGEPIDLHVERSAEQLLLRGPMGGRRSLVRATPEVLEWTAQDLQVTLRREAGAPGEPVMYSDPTRSVRLRLSGCAPAELLRRPGLMAVVNWLVHNTDQILPIAPTTGLHSDGRSGSPAVQPDPPPAASPPKPQRP